MSPDATGAEPYSTESTATSTGPDAPNTQRAQDASPTNNEIPDQSGSIGTPTPESIEAIEADVNREREEAGMPTLDDSSNLPIYGGPDLWGAVRERIERGPNLTGWDFDWNGFMGDLYQVGQSAIYGLGSGAEEAAETVTDVGAKIDDTLTKPIGRLVGSILGVPRERLDAVEADLDASHDELRDAIPNIAEMLGVPKPDTAVENIVGTVTPFVASYMLGTKALEGTALVSRLAGMQIPGVLGQGLTRIGVTGGGTGRTLLEMLKGGATAGTFLPEDSDNFADLLKALSSDSGPMGSISRAWLNNVPGESLLVKDAEDDPLTKRFKNALDAAYGEVLGPLAYLTIRNARVGLAAAKSLPGTFDRAILKQAAAEQQAVTDLLEKLGNDSSNEAALRMLFPESGAASDDVTEGALRGSVTHTEAEPLLDATTGPSDEAIVRGETSTAPPRRQIPIADVHSGKADNYSKTLDHYSDVMYRETSVERLGDMLSGSGVGPMGPERLFFSNDPSLALGQGTNKGVTVEVDASKIRGQVSRGKPGQALTAETGNVGEFTGTVEGKPVDAIRKITIQKGNKLSPREQGILRQLDGNAAFERSETAEAVVYTKRVSPSVADEVPMSDAPVEAATTGVPETATGVNAPSEASLAGSAPSLLTMSPESTLSRIRAAQDAADEADRLYVSNLPAYTRNYETMVRETGTLTETSFFDSEGYLKHLTDSVDDPVRFKQALGDWSGFMAVPENGPIPSLLNPKQLAAWEKTPMDVTGNIIDAVKRLTTTNPARKAEAVQFLADLLGNSLDADNRKIAEGMLKATAKSTASVDMASRQLLANQVFVTNHVVPDLEKALRIAANGDPGGERVALRLVRTINEYTEANKNLKSAAGRLLQSTQIDPTLEGRLREVYGPEQYRKMFGIGSGADDVAENVADDVAEGVADDVAEGVADNAPLTASERAQLTMLQQRWGVVDASQRPAFASSVYRAGQHPVWRSLGNTGTFAVDLMGNLTMSAMLFHPATWMRVFTGAVTAGLYDSSSQVLGAQLLKRGGKAFEPVFRGAPIDSTTYDVMTFGGLWRALSFPYSLLVAGKSFIRPGWQEVYSLGSTVYKSSPILGPEMIERSFGKDTATRIFTAAGGVPGRLLRGLGAGLGFPQHILGSIETMINHGALSSRVAEDLYTRALNRGLSGGAARDFVFEHISDAMEDAVVAGRVPRGGVALRNRAGITIDELRNLQKTGGQNADYSSLRETGYDKPSDISPLASTTVGDTIPFRLERSFTSFVSGLPVVGPLARASLIPFGRVTANMVGRMVSPIQGVAAMASRAASIPGFPSRYIDEVVGGLHGPHRQTQLMGHMAIATALFMGGIANMWHLQQSGREISYPLGPAAEREATNERGVRYGETPLPDGSTVTTLGFNPFVTPFNEGNYLAWIMGRYGLTPFLQTAAKTGDLLGMDLGVSPDDRFRGAEGSAHVGNWILEAAPFETLFKGLNEVFGAARDSSGDVAAGVGGVLTGLGGTLGSALERPLRIPDLLPGHQVPGRSTSLRDDGPLRAFRTGAAGFSGQPNMDRINAYDVAGQLLPDKYDPAGGIDQFLEAFGLPSVRPYDSSNLGRFLGELESHGIAFSTAERKVNLRVGGNVSSVPINLQHWYNPRTKEHLWDVYNRFLRDTRTTSWVNFNDTKEMTLKAALEELAGESLRTERGESGSRVVRIGDYRKRILSAAADKMSVNMAVMRSWARDSLETYLIENGKDFVDSDGNTLPQYAELMYNATRPKPASGEAEEQ